MDPQTVLQLVKDDLSITTDKRDGYIISCINAAAAELERQGVTLSDTADDTMLLSDYVSWTYRHRDNGADLPVNLKLRIRNRITRYRSEGSG